MRRNKKRYRVILDANWYISACLSRHSRRTLYYQILKNPRIEVYYSADLMAEFDGVISRPKFSKKIRSNQVNRFKAIVLEFLKETDVGDVPNLVRDEKDNYLLGMCESCQADFLITGDNDLLVLKTYKDTSIVSMGEFLEIFST